MNNAIFLDAVKRQLKIKTDRRLAALLGFTAEYIGSIRRNRVPLTDSILLRILEATDWSIREVREMLKS